MAPLKALLLSDGRPGHLVLAEGILAAMARLRPVDCRRVEVRRPRWLPQSVLAAAVNHGMRPSRVLSAVYGVAAGDLPVADLVVSAGGDTLAANIAAARCLGVPNLFYGSLRRFNYLDFALVLTSYARHAGKPRHLVTPKPSKLDPDRIVPPDARRAFGPDAPPRTAGLLVGGNSGTMTWERADWDRLIALLKATSRTYRMAWLISNSRRTPPAVSEALAWLAAEPQSPVAHFVDVRKAGSGTLEQVFALSEVILVTADSSSMLSESIWLRRPTIAVAPENNHLPPDEQDYRRFLAERGWTRAALLADLTPERFLALLQDIRPLTENPLDSLARELAQRLPELFREAGTETTTARR